MHTLDDSQAAALTAIRGAAPGTAHLIAGAAGTGKTSCLLALAGELAGADVMILAANRHAASELRGQLTRELGQLPRGMAVRTAHAWAFSIAQDFAADHGRHTPELITGPNQDAILAEILEETAEQISWPAGITEEVRSLPAFRHQLRDLLTRAAECGLDAAELTRLGEESGDEMWRAAGQVYGAYRSFLALADALEPGGRGADRLDHASMLRTAQSYLVGQELWNDPQSVPRWDWVLVDDYENATLAQASLLRQAQDLGARIVLTADPDGAVEGFRGGIAHLPAASRSRSGEIGMGAQLHVLTTAHRGGPRLAAARQILTGEIASAGLIRQRSFAPGSEEDAVEIRTFPSADAELSNIARQLRRRHIRAGVAYDDMAVLTRSRAEHGDIERVLLAAGVAVRPAASALPLRYSPLVRDLMGVISAAIERADGAAWEEMGERRLRDLLTGPLLGMTGKRLRQCERFLRPLAAEGGRPGDSIIWALTAQPEEWWAADVLRLGRIIDATADAVREGAEEALRRAWQAADRADDWQARALGETAPQADGIDGRSAGRLLDDGMKLFRFAQRMVDRDPGASAADLLDALTQQELVEDSIAREGLSRGVHLLTPAMAVGREFDTVVIASLVDGIWPNPQIRDGVFGAGRLVDRLLGRISELGGEERQRRGAVRAVIDDELRMLVFSLGRAKRRLVMTSVDNEDTSPSRFIDRLALGGLEPQRILGTRIAVTLTGIVGALRSALSDPEMSLSEAERDGAAALIALLARHDVAGADPERWLSIAEPTELRRWKEESRVSPSQIERMSECPLRWFLQTHGLVDVADRDAMDLGNMLHRVAEYAAGGHDDVAAEYARQREEYVARFDGGFERERALREADARFDSLRAYLADVGARAEAEQRLTATYEASRGPMEISGIVDRIEQGERGPVIIDFKTGKQVPSLEAGQANAQLRTYQWAYERERGVSTGGANLVYVGKPRSNGLPTVRSQDPLNEQSTRELEALFEDVAGIISSAQLEARANDGCSHCPMAVACPLMEEGRVFA